MKPKFSTLIILTLITAALLVPYAVSELYLPTLLEQDVDPSPGGAIAHFLRSDLYKQGTGFVLLALVLVEVGLALRKRGRRWKIKLPGSMLFWRSIHIFLGIALFAVVLIHTVGATGSNFNAIFLWVFFLTGLSALIGVVAETGILESSQKYFGLPLVGHLQPFKAIPALDKGKLIRGLRGVWLLTHIFLVTIFLVMLGFHIFLAYYFQ